MLSIFGILGEQNAFYIICNGMDDSFDVKNGAGKEFIDTGK